MKIKEKVVILFTMLDDSGIERLKEEVEEVVQVRKLDMQKLMAEVSDATVLFIGSPEVDRGVLRGITTKLIEQGPKLKALVVPGRAFDFVDTQAAASRNLPILFSTAYEDSIAEHIIAMMLCAARKIQYLGQEFRAGRFPYEMRAQWAGDELSGKNVGIVGLGKIGRCLAQKCKLGFATTVFGYDPYIGQHLISDLGISMVDKLARLLEESDFVCLTAICTDETGHMIGTRELGQMKRTAYLTNITPGLVDEKALIQALENGTIAGAGLDVFDPDPPDSNNPLFRFMNVAVTPHVAGHTKECKRRMALDNAESIIEFLRTQAAQ